VLLGSLSDAGENLLFKSPISGAVVARFNSSMTSALSPLVPWGAVLDALSLHALSLLRLLWRSLRCLVRSRREAGACCAWTEGEESSLQPRYLSTVLRVLTECVLRSTRTHDPLDTLDDDPAQLC
jgi:hypothetical protein